MLPHKYMQMSRLLMGRTPEPAPHEQGQSVFTEQDIRDEADKTRIVIRNIVDAQGNLRLAKEGEELPEGAHWLEDEQLPDTSNGVK